jgi:epoxide hydrolase-like predicted phosphatase
MIKGIIFDLGGVYLNRGIKIAFREKFAKKFDINPDENKPTPVFSDHLYPSGFMSGKITEEEYWKLCGKDLRVKIDSDELRMILLDGYEEQEETSQLVKRLRGSYKLGLLSDMPKEWMDLLEKKFNIFVNFDVIVVSGYEGMSKPDPEIYELAIKKMGLRPDECVFIDDREINLEYPPKMGIKTILFRSCDQLKKDLAVLGVTV